MQEYVPTLEFSIDDIVELALPSATIAELDAERLVDAMIERFFEETELLELVTKMGAPPEDCLATLMSARASLMAAARGRAFYQHELRGRIPMTDANSPEVDVGPTVPEWEGGAFVEPKYFSFMQDAPFAAFNPVHRRKWRPHELLHGAVGFYWHPEMTRFEAYVGARLNELLPVVHWYGFDEMFRPRCDRHRGEVLGREWCSDCEDAVRPYWEVEVRDEDRATAIAWANRGREHFVNEMTCCREEIATGTTRPNRQGALDASSDAVGYLYGHWPRLRSWSFRVWMELFARPGFDYFDDLSAYANRVEACASRLVGGVLAVTPQRFEALRQRRTIQDLGYRALLALEWNDPTTARGRDCKAAVIEALEHAAGQAETLLDSDDSADAATETLSNIVEVLTHFRDDLPEEVAEPLLACGLDWFVDGRDADWEVMNLAQGVSDAMPLTADSLDAGILDSFRASIHLRMPGRLATRFAAYLDSCAQDKPHYREPADVAALEGWAAEDPRRDEEAERFSMPVRALDLVDPRWLRVNQTFRRSVFTGAAVASLLHHDDPPELVELAAAYWRDQFHVVFVDDDVRAALDAVEEQRLPDGSPDALLELIDAGLVVYLPAVRRQQ